jgi:hypothetical protein
MRYRGENLVENSVNEGRRGWDLEDIAGDSLNQYNIVSPLTPHKLNKLSEPDHRKAFQHKQSGVQTSQYNAKTEKTGTKHGSLRTTISMPYNEDGSGQVLMSAAMRATAAVRSTSAASVFGVVGPPRLKRTAAEGRVELAVPLARPYSRGIAEQQQVSESHLGGLPRRKENVWGGQVHPDSESRGRDGLGAQAVVLARTRTK